MRQLPDPFSFIARPLLIFMNLTTNLILEACVFLLQETSNKEKTLNESAMEQEQGLTTTDDWQLTWNGPVITIHECVSLMSHDVTTWDQKLSPGNCDLAPHIAPSPTIKLGPNYRESLCAGHTKEEAISIYSYHWYRKITYCLFRSYAFRFLIRGNLCLSIWVGVCYLHYFKRNEILFRLPFCPMVPSPLLLKSDS